MPPPGAPPPSEAGWADREAEGSRPEETTCGTDQREEATLGGGGREARESVMAAEWEQLSGGATIAQGEQG